MTKYHAYLAQTQWWMDVLTENASTLIRLSPPLRLRYVRAELAEQTRNYQLESDRYEKARRGAAAPEKVPVHARRMTLIQRDVEVLRRCVVRLTPSQA